MIHKNHNTSLHTQIIYGSHYAQIMLQQLKIEILEYQKTGAVLGVPTLVIILLGDNHASKIYVNNKVKQAANVGIICRIINLDLTTTQDDLILLLARLNHDKSVHGIIVQLPLPQHINTLNIINNIDYRKDVDGFHPLNIGYLASGYHDGFVACTPSGCMHLIKAALGQDLGGKHVVVVGRSLIVGKPMSYLLTNANCTTTLAHSQTINLKSVTTLADIVILAVGKAKMFDKTYFNSNAVVIDVGINKAENSSLSICGDADFDDCFGHVKYITPVPYGVGPMTIAYLLYNTFIAYKKSLDLPLKSHNKF